MKIQCDVCNKDQASVFCTADEAALCDSCDHRVHHANKLASKHQRFSLLYSSSKQIPLCDICQEKRGFLFCQQDRAILCRECDISIHTANEHTQKHNRFLLTGVKLSPTAALYTTTTNGCDSVPDLKSHQQQQSSPTKKPDVSNSNPPSVTKTLTSSNTTTTTMNKDGDNDLVISDGDGSTSSISEYLQMLPGWHVEDFLDSSSAPFGFTKDDYGMLPLLDSGLDNNMIWVPQASTPLYPSQYASSQMGGQFGFKETKEATNFMIANNRRLTDDAFTVPQISPPSVGSKRSRPLW